MRSEHSARTAVALSVSDVVNVKQFSHIQAPFSDPAIRIEERTLGEAEADTRRARKLVDDAPREPEKRNPIEAVLEDLNGRYCVGERRGVLPRREEEAIGNLYGRSHYHKSVSNQWRFRDKSFWHFRVVTLSFHLHPSVRKSDVSRRKADHLMDGLRRIIEGVYGEDGKYHLGYSMRHEPIAMNHLSGVNPHHFDVPMLPLRLTRTEYTSLKDDPDGFLRKILQRGAQFTHIRCESKAGSEWREWFAYRKAEDFFFHVQDEVYLRKVSRRWLRLQRKVFHLGEEALSGAEYKLVDVSPAPAEEYWTKTTADAARQCRYHFSKLKVEQACLRWSAVRKKIHVRSRRSGRGHWYKPLRFFRRFLFYPFVVKTRTYGLLRPRSPFRVVLDLIFGNAEGPESILYWATLPVARLPWYVQRHGVAVLRYALWEFDVDQVRPHPRIPRFLFSGKYGDIVDYLRWLVEHPPRGGVTRPTGITERVTLAESYKTNGLLFSTSPTPRRSETPWRTAGPTSVKQQAVAAGEEFRAHERRMVPTEFRSPNPVRRFLAMKGRLDSGAVKNRAALAHIAGITRARVSQVMGLASLAPEVITLLSAFDRMPGRLSERWLREKLRRESETEQMAMLQRRFGRALERMEKETDCV